MRNSRETSSLPERVRAAAAWVAARSGSVTIERGAIEGYAKTLPLVVEPHPLDPATHFLPAGREGGIAFVLCLDAINFGSGWWPTIRKRPGRSGYFTITAGLSERFRALGPWSAAELTRISAAEIAAVTGQDAGHPLMAEYAVSLRDVGAHVGEEHDGRFEGVVEAAARSAVVLAGLLSGWDAFADASTYEGRDVPFYKRAQIAATDLDRAGLAELAEGERLTAFADNLVPHVLRVDGVLRLDPTLEAKIETGELLVHGSPEEVELRACAVHAVELLADAVGRRLSPAQIDGLLWNRGRAPRYKSRPRPRSRNTAY